jgi:hypothetical protein
VARGFRGGGTNARPINRQLGLRWVPGRFIVAFTDSRPRALLARFARDYVSLPPVYMVHQYEEHDNDRFRLFVNEKIGKQRVGLSPLAVFVINVPGVWGVIGISLALAATVSARFGLVAAYLVLLHSRRSGGHFPRLQPRTGNRDRLVSSTRRIRYRRHSAGWRRDFLDAHERSGSGHCHSRRNYRPHNAPTTRALTHPQLRSQAL